MNRDLGRNIMRAMLLAIALGAAACGGETSVASKSAEAYREAQAKGTPVGGGHEHGGHAATETTATVDPSAHGGPNAQPEASAHAGMGHGGTAANAHAGHTAHRRASGAAHDQHGAMRTAAAAGANAHAHHGAMQMTASANARGRHESTSSAAPVTVEAPRSNAEMQRLQPAATLRGDAFDAPAAVAVAEAARSAHGGGHEGHGMSGAAAPAGAPVYTCPMHPEVRSDEPGTCPKCGMTLVVQKEK